jgi:excisionase family DNA binding protein
MDPTQKISMEWLGLRQLSRYADVSERTLRAWIHSPVDPLPAVRVRGKMLVRRGDLDAWLEKHRANMLETVDLDRIVQDVLKGVDRGRQGTKAEGTHLVVRGHRSPWPA